MLFRSKTSPADSSRKERLDVCFDKSALSQQFSGDYIICVSSSESCEDLYLPNKISGPAGDFDIEWANNPGTFPWQIQQLAEFRKWLVTNGFDPDDRDLTIGHPQVGQVDLLRSFGSEDYVDIWNQLNTHLNVMSVATSESQATYDYCWSDPDYMQQQLEKLK